MERRSAVLDTTRHKGSILLALCLAALIINIDVTIVNVSSAEYHARQFVRIIKGDHWDA